MADYPALAAQLAAADEAERSALLRGIPTAAGAELARALKALYDATESSDPPAAARAGAALGALAATSDDAEVLALGDWVAGALALDQGAMEAALGALERAAARFDALGQRHAAASVQVSRLIALAILGRYDDAIAAGQLARDVFLAEGDVGAAGKIEQNLGNIYHRREQYREAERCYRSARASFAALGDQRLLASAENGLANVLALQHHFREAQQLYGEALRRATAANLGVLQALLECNLGCLELFQGHYDRALAFLEQARRRYGGLGAEHMVASTELELADAYLELNLAEEARAIYGRIAPQFARLGMRAEQARAAAGLARACLLLGRRGEAYELLGAARVLYDAEGNGVGAALVTLTEAELRYAEGALGQAAALAAQAEAPLAAAEMWRWLLAARWLRGEAARAQGQEARPQLEATLRDAELQAVPQVARRCSTSLGLLCAAGGDMAGARGYFERAVALTEATRQSVPAGEVRTAFSADKLVPYTELARLCLGEPGPDAAAIALGYVEQARARALMDMLQGRHLFRPAQGDAVAAELLGELERLREDLNWLYHRIDQVPQTGEPRHDSSAARPLTVLAREREAALQEIVHRLQIHAGRAGAAAATPLSASPELGLLQLALGADTALVEYFTLGDELLAFVVTSEEVAVVRELAGVGQLEALVRGLHFQLRTLRQGSARLRPHLGQLAERARYYLAELYNLLLRPLAQRLQAPRLAIVPHGVLHYVPFHALYDGAAYAIEQHELCAAPSAMMLRHCLALPPRRLERAVLVGVPDQHIPHVGREIEAIGRQFPGAATALAEGATVAAVRALAPGAELLHIACHARFRADSPFFSALQLADGWLTVHDICELELGCELVTLSSCDTGMSSVAAGNELLGLARGFFLAGAPTLLVSLWAADDEATAECMARFYAELRAGARPAAALRHAQRTLLETYPHPALWASFAVLGRW